MVLVLSGYQRVTAMAQANSCDTELRVTYLSHSSSPLGLWRFRGPSSLFHPLLRLSLIGLESGLC